MAAQCGACYQHTTARVPYAHPVLSYYIMHYYLLIELLSVLTSLDPILGEGSLAPFGNNCSRRAIPADPHPAPIFSSFSSSVSKFFLSSSLRGPTALETRLLVYTVFVVLPSRFPLGVGRKAPRNGACLRGNEQPSRKPRNGKLKAIRSVTSFTALRDFLSYGRLRNRPTSYIVRMQALSRAK